MTNDYTEVARLAMHQLALERTIAELEVRMAGFRNELRLVQEFDLPEAVDSLEWDEERMTMDEEGDRVTLTLPELPAITVKDTFHPHLKDRDRADAIQWIKAHGGASLLTTELSLSFRRGTERSVIAVVETLAKMEETIPEIGTMNVREAIHHATLAKFCRDKIAEGEDVPELLGLFNRRVASVTP